MPTETDQEQVKVSVFYRRLPRVELDPDAIKWRGVPLYGEGIVLKGHELGSAGQLSARTESLGNGLRLLHLEGSLSETAAVLSSNSFDNNGERFTFGLIERPETVGLPGTKGRIGGPIPGARRIVQFCCLEKIALLESLTPDATNQNEQRDQLGSLFEKLVALGGVELRGDPSRWLGDVLIAHRENPIVWWTPIATGSKSYRTIKLEVVEQGDPLHVHVRIMGLDGICISDQLIEWQPRDASPKRLTLAEEVSHVELRVWRNGKLIQEETSAVLRGINTQIQLVGNRLTLEDRLAKRLKGAVRAKTATTSLLEKTEQAGSGGPTVSSSTSSALEPWARGEQAAEATFDLLRPPPPPYARFPKSRSGRATAINRFAELITGAEQAHLIDPFFDRLGAEALLPRIGGNGAISILTNLPLAHKSQVASLSAFLKNASVGGFVRNTTVCVLSHKDPSRQLFHDRFLLARKGSCWRGYVITNSFSGMAENYPVYVVETSTGTTSLLLDDFETLLAEAPKVEQVWPREGLSPTSPRAQDRGFVSQMSVVARLLPRGRWTKHRALRAAAHRGYLSLSEDGISWRVSNGKRDAMMTLLFRLATGSSKFRRKNLRTQNTRRTPPKLGDLVLQVGEMTARGMDVDPADLAQRIESRSLDLVEALRKSFREPQNPSEASSRTTLGRMELRQTLNPEVTLAEGIRIGATLWNGDDRLRSGRHKCWDRTFGYAVLSYVDPVRAVRLAEELRDADFLLCHTGFLHRKMSRWSEEAALALCRSQRATLRGLGLQALAHRRFEPEAPGHRLTPANVDQAVSRLRDAGLPKLELALLLTCWATQRPVVASQTVSGKLASILMELTEKQIVEVVGMLLDANHISAEALDSLTSEIFAHNQRNSVALAARIVAAYCETISTETGETFFGSHDVRILEVIAKLVRFVGQENAQDPWAVLSQLCDVSGLQKSRKPLTPFRFRAQAGNADLAYGQLLLADLLAAPKVGSDGAWTVPVDTRQRVEKYLDQTTLGNSKQLRAYLSDTLSKLNKPTQ